MLQRVVIVVMLEVVMSVVVFVVVRAVLQPGLKSMAVARALVTMLQDQHRRDRCNS